MGLLMPRTLAHSWQDDNALEVNSKPTLSEQRKPERPSVDVERGLNVFGQASRAALARSPRGSTALSPNSRRCLPSNSAPLSTEAASSFSLEQRSTVSLIFPST